MKVFEARDRVGGRAWSREFPGTGVMVDLGAEWVAPGQHTAILDEYARYGIELADAEATERDLWLLHGDVLHGRFPFDGAEREAFDAFTTGLAEHAAALAAAAPFTAPEGTDVALADRAHQATQPDLHHPLPAVHRHIGHGPTVEAVDPPGRCFAHRTGHSAVGGPCHHPDGLAVVHHVLDDQRRQP